MCVLGCLSASLLGVPLCVVCVGYWEFLYVCYLGLCVCFCVCVGYGGPSVCVFPVCVCLGYLGLCVCVCPPNNTHWLSISFLISSTDVSWLHKVNTHPKCQPTHTLTIHMDKTEYNLILDTKHKICVTKSPSRARKRKSKGRRQEVPPNGSLFPKY